MIQTIPFKETTIRFFEEGQGEAVVLLHGYLESLDVWEDFSTELSKEYHVISIDLLGHGKSGTISETHSMELMADAVNDVLTHLNIEKCTLIGHSMGGYVTLAFLENYPEKLNAFSLFHSTPMADNEVKKSEREIVIKELESGKKVEICKAHVPKTFANENIAKFVREIGFGKIIALNTPLEGIIAALNGMKTRKNYSELLKNTKTPFLYILGKKDNFIPASILKHFSLPENNSLLILENSGHQGYIEEKEKSLIEIKKFLKNK